jgi:hypothetical protein
MTLRRRRPRIFRWDLDKTYLVSHFDSFRDLVRVPFQKGEDKVAVPGVASLMKGLDKRAARDDADSRVYFLTASPPQIGGAIREKLRLDGIRHDGITFKRQVSHLVRGRFDALREQVGYKLDRLLAAAEGVDTGSLEYLFGDDWESDPFVYSLYADILAGKASDEFVLDVLERADVHKQYKAAIRERLVKRASSRRMGHRVGGIFILRQRPVAEFSLAAFGPRLCWFDNYFECALVLYSHGLLGADGVEAVAASIGLTPDELAGSYEAAMRRPGVEAGRFAAPLRRLRARGLMGRTHFGGPATRMATVVRRAMRLPPSPALMAGEMPHYSELARRWSRRGRKEARLEEDEKSREVLSQEGAVEPDEREAEAEAEVVPAAKEDRNGGGAR